MGNSVGTPESVAGSLPKEGVCGNLGRSRKDLRHSSVAHDGPSLDTVSNHRGNALAGSRRASGRNLTDS